MSNKTEREMELIILRLNSQIESKNEQIAELNTFIRNATENTQELIKNFRSFCIKVLESELAYGDISSRDLEAMSLNDLLCRARKMLKQNQEKAREIYDTFKERLTQKNAMIQGLTDQVSQLKFMIDNAEIMFNTPYELPDDEKRAAAILLDTDTPIEALKPSISMTTVVGENERVVDFEGATEKDAVDLISDGKMFVQNFDDIYSQMKEIHWSVFEMIVSNGISELSVAKEIIFKKLALDGKDVSIETVGRAIRQLVTLCLFSQQKINTGIRWFFILNLTDTGRKIYIDKYKAVPPESECKKIIREHENATHGYLIKDVAKILEDSGKYRSVSMSRRGNTINLPNGKVCIPDIVCCQKNSIDYFEVECGNHHQSDFNDKCNKLKKITQNLYFVTPNKEVADKRLKPQIEKWIKSCGASQLKLSGVTVYLTSVSDLAAQKWSYVFDMQKDEPIHLEDDTTSDETDEKSDNEGMVHFNDEFSK